jgi:hypothetical protein
MNMQFKWLLDRVQQGQFKTNWKPGKTNLADYFTTHHPPAHHQCVRRIFNAGCRVAEIASGAMETSLAMTDGIMFPNCSARVC